MQACPEAVDVLVIGGGQAGLAMSEHLRRNGVSHLVVERHRVAERWRSERWDSLRSNGPAWHDRLSPDHPFPPDLHVADDDFASKDQIVAYLERFAARIAAPIRCGVNVDELLPRDGPGRGFVARTSRGETIAAERVVVATGPFQKPAIPVAIGEGAEGRGGLVQLHSRDYRNPDALPPGAVLVVGSGSSGAQIADELLRAGRRVFLSVGRHQRPPRRYRGRDNAWWLDRLGGFDARTPPPSSNTKHVAVAVSGGYLGGGGEPATVDFREMAGRGLTLLGRVAGLAASGGGGGGGGSGGSGSIVLRIAPDLRESVARGDRDYFSMLAEADELVRREPGLGLLQLPEEPAAHEMLPDPPCLADPLLELDLGKEGVSAVVWATGYDVDFGGWLRVPGALDDAGFPVHQEGVSRVPGLYFIGLPWLSRRASAFMFGVWDDAEYIARHIAQGVVPVSSEASRLWAYSLHKQEV